ncbi:MAG: hypothetical protein AAFX96_13480 [Pseudomonadota bacterium]
MFWSRSSISDDMRYWKLDCFEWFDEMFEPPKLPILPTKSFFSAPGGRDLATAKLVLEEIKGHMNLEEEVDMYPIKNVPPEHRHEYQALSSIAGTYEKIDGSSVIRYDPELMQNPIIFINMLAHELMHARLNGLEDEIPGGEEAHELATDLGCVIAGFGAFQLQAADDAGWFGYLSQPSRAFALAVFLDRRGLGIEAVEKYLSSRCKKYMRRAFKDL